MRRFETARRVFFFDDDRSRYVTFIKETGEQTEPEQFESIELRPTSVIDDSPPSWALVVHLGKKRTLLVPDAVEVSDDDEVSRQAGQHR